MRMWMTAPEIMCKNHILGEHKELHMLAGCVLKNKSLTGYIDQKIIELTAIKSRHDQLVEEFRRRSWDSGFDHQSPIFQPDVSHIDGYETIVDINVSIAELRHRCAECAKRINKNEL